jgi:G3E family GTPase
MSGVREPVVAHLITGFLGAGKTSLLNRLLAQPALADTAVIINEFGDVGIDHLLVQSVDDDVVLLKSGCICCTIRVDLKNTILSLFERVRRGEISPFSRLVIETTGLADPAPIIATLSADLMLKYHLRLGNVITVVDVPNGVANLASFAESRRQVAVADHIIISKGDLADAGALTDLRQQLARICGAADVVVLDEMGEPAQALLLDTLNDPASRVAAVAPWLGVDGGQDLGHEVGQHGTIGTFVLEADQAIAWPRFALWLSMLIHSHGRKILRLKGLIDIEGAETPVVVHGVQHLIHKPLHLPAWPDGVRRTRIVVIGEGLDRNVMQRSLAAFCLSGQEAQPEQAAQ